MSLIKEYRYVQGQPLDVCADMMEAWRADGAVIIRNLIPPNEMILLRMNMECPTIKDAAFNTEDGTGVTKSRLVLWNQPGSDVSGVISRSEKLVRTTEKLLGGEVFHYHTKLIPKQPRTGGVFQWHQDYGYWYKNGNLTPDMNTVFIAIDRCDTDNGCLEVMPGSHRCGRIDHEPIGGQQGANVDRVEMLKKRFSTVPVILNSGDALFFHSNIVHRSNANTSDRRRWALLVAYNTRANESRVKHHHSPYVPLDVVPDSAILECSNVDDVSGKDFIDPKTDKTVGKVEYINKEDQKNM